MPPLDTTQVNDWITAPAVRPNAPTVVATGEAAPTPSPAAGAVTSATPEVNDWITAPAAPSQSQLGADISAVGQGAVSGTGAVIAGIGRQPTAAAAQGTQSQLAVMDAIDAGKDVPQDQDTIGYQFLSPDQRAKARADFTAANVEISKRDPNALTRAGTAMESAAPGLFPVDPALEGRGTAVGRMVGGMAPALVASAAGGAVGGPVGAVMAGAAVVGSQTYDGVYQEAIAKGQTPEQADDAAGKSAAVQMAAMSLPISKIIPFIPVPLREGFLKTIANVGANFVQRGGEMGAGNTLATVAQNYVASQTYDPGRPVFNGTGDAAIDGILAGLVVHGATAAAGAVRTGVMPEAVAPRPTVADIGAAPDIDGAIAAAGKVAETPTAAVPADDLAQTIMNPPGSRPETAVPAWGDLFAQPAAADAGAPSGPSIPQSVGAATSRDMANPNAADISTADMKANRRRAEMDQLHAPAQAGDTMIHVPGSFPTLAERSADPVLSQYENLLRERVPQAFVGDGKILTENNKARVAEYDNNTIPDTTLNTMRKDREAQWVADSKEILPTAKPADLTPVEDWVLGQLSDPRIQENDAVRSVLENFRDRLVDDGGNLKTDPAAVWGIHDNLQNQLAKAKDPLNATGAERYAEGQIIAAKSLIDQAMNVATDGKFQTAMTNYAEASKAINAGVIFNGYRDSGKLTNMNGELQAQRFHNFVLGLAKERGDPGIDPTMDISDQGMRSMINIDNDLKRAKLIKLGAPSGSQTNLLTALAETAGLNAAHGIVGKIPLAGGLLVEGQKYFAQRKLVADAMKHIAPPEGGYRYPEPPDEPTPAPGGPSGPSGGGGPGTPPSPGPLFNAPPAPPAAPAPAPAPAAAAATPLRATTGAGPGESVAFTPSGQAVAVRYTARDASNITASQLADGRTNPAFPAALQPRDRTRAASIQQVNAIANRLQPERLGASASTSEGAPIIGPDGAVESGNGRTLAIMQAYADGGPLADAYRAWVAAQGHDTTGMQNPILVRERVGDLDMPSRARLAADMGASPIAGMSAPERAAADARAIPTEILSMYQGGDVTLAKNAAFARAFAEHVIPPGEQASFMTTDGNMSADGAIRVRNALTQHAYGSNSLVTSLAENADPDIKAFGGALVDAAGDMAKLRGAIDSGTVSSASDIAPDIVAAAQLIQTARRQRISLADAVGQRDAFSVLPEKTEDILQAAFGGDYAGRMSRARMADLLSAFAQEAQMQSGLFGANLTAGEMLAEARAKYGYGTKAGAKSGSGVPVGNGPGLDFNRPQAQ